MDVSIFLARAYGLYFMIFGLAFVMRTEQIIQVIRDIYRNKTLLFVAAAVTIILGIPIVVSHSIWELSWKVIITVFGYLTLLKGVLILYVPEVVEYVYFTNNKCVHRCLYGALALIGLCLFSVSFLKN